MTNLIKILTFAIITILFVNNVVAQTDEYDDPCIQEIEKPLLKKFEKARNLQREGKKADAIAMFHSILEEKEDYLDAHFYLGMAYYYPIEIAKFYIDKQKHKPQEAIYHFRKINEVCLDYKFEHNLYAARLAYLSKSYKEAIEFGEICLDNPDMMPQLDQLDEAEMIVKKSKFFDEIYSNPVPFDPEPIAGISTTNDEYLGKLSPDGAQFYFTRRRDVTTHGAFGGETQSKEFFTISTRHGTEVFAIGEPLPYPFNQSNNEGSPTVNLTNDLLIFARMTLVKINGSNYPNYDLYFSQWIDEEWTTPESLGNLVNTNDYWESQPSINSAGDVLYFASDRAGGYGGSDIWYTERGENGRWEKPVNAGPIINTKGNERSPFLHSDSKTLYFSSSGHEGLGGMDIFYSKMNNERWQTPRNIGYPINTENDDVDFFVSLNGKTGYYSSNRVGNKDWNIFQFELYEEARPRDVALLKGTINNEEEDLTGITIEIRDTAMQVVATTTVDTLTGKYALITEVDAHNPAPLIMNIKKEGFAYDTRLVDVDLSETRAITTETTMQKIEKGKSYNLRDIQFPTNSYALTSESKNIIKLFAEFLNDNPTVIAEIQGHTDNVGDDKLNQILSENRANSVYQYLINSLNIAPSRLSHNGYGPFQPIASNDNEAGRAKNRRTVFKIINY